MRLYITGGTGMFGSHVIKIAREQYHAEIIASLYGAPPDNPVNYELDPLDLADHDGITRSIQKYKPDVVIHSAAILNLLFLTENRQVGWSVMVEGTRRLAQASRDVGARFIFVSSDWVFDGTQPLVDEDSPPHPVNFYGIMKMAVERELSVMADLNYAIARLAALYGENLTVRSMTERNQVVGYSLGNYFANRLRSGKHVEVWMGPKVNEIAHPSLSSDAAEMVMRLTGYDGNGIFHCIGTEAVSRLDFALLFADVLGCNPGLVKPVPTPPPVVDAYRHIQIPLQTRMSCEKTERALGRSMMNAREGVEAYIKELDERDA